MSRLNQEIWIVETNFLKVSRLWSYKPIDSIICDHIKRRPLLEQWKLLSVLIYNFIIWFMEFKFDQVPNNKTRTW
jgi:hypothetical protein